MRRGDVENIVQSGKQAMVVVDRSRSSLYPSIFLICHPQHRTDTVAYGYYLAPASRRSNGAILSHFGGHDAQSNQGERRGQHERLEFLSGKSLSAPVCIIQNPSIGC